MSEEQKALMTGKTVEWVCGPDGLDDWCAGPVIIHFTDGSAVEIVSAHDYPMEVRAK